MKEHNHEEEENTRVDDAMRRLKEEEKTRGFHHAQRRESQLKIVGSYIRDIQDMVKDLCPDIESHDRYYLLESLESLETWTFRRIWQNKRDYEPKTEEE